RSHHPPRRRRERRAKRFEELRQQSPIDFGLRKDDDHHVCTALELALPDPANQRLNVPDAGLSFDADQLTQGCVTTDPTRAGRPAVAVAPPLQPATRSTGSPGTARSTPGAPCLGSALPRDTDLPRAQVPKQVL